MAQKKKSVPSAKTFSKEKSRERKPDSRNEVISSLLASEAFGKLPPQAVDLEQAVLGALLLEKDALTEVIEILKPEYFYKDSHQRIYQAIQDLFQKNEPVDILTVTHQLKFTNELDLVGGPYYITELTARVGSSANVEYHARIIVQKYIQRELIGISSEVIKNAYEDSTDVFDLLDSTEQNLFELSDSNLRKKYAPVRDVLGKVIKQIQELKSKGAGLTGVPSGFSYLDNLTSGFQKSELIILAARPSMGKTAFALTVARNAAVEYKMPVAFFSLEMSSEALVQRLICAEAELDAQHVRSGRLQEHQWAQLIARVDKIHEAPFYIDETPALSILDLRAKARRLKSEKNIELLIVDYLQLMHGNVSSRNLGNREQEIASISRSLKALSKELDIPIIALSQLSRQVEMRGGTKRPQLSDLRESGSIEQDADVVIFLNRLEMYGIEQDERGASTRGMAEVIIGKQRNGPTGMFNTRFLNHYAKFVDVNTSGTSETVALSDAGEFTGTPRSITLRSRINDEPSASSTEEEQMPF